VKVSGSHTLAAPPERVWAALLDPAVLVVTLPGCTRLEVTGPDAYAATVEAGVASIKGVYEATVTIADKVEGSAYTLRAVGAGAPGTVDATARVTLTAAGDATTVAYDADAVVGGTVAAVGQRMLAAVAKRTAAEFFGNVDAALAGRVPGAARWDVRAGSAPETTVFAAPSPASVPNRDRLTAMVTGALLVLLGILVGRRLGGRP
jgi:uncharacterized protein